MTVAELREALAALKAKDDDLIVIEDGAGHVPADDVLRRIQLRVFGEPYNCLALSKSDWP
jgi:hypothetical protein